MENDQKIWDVIRKVGLGHKLSIHNVDLDTYLSKEMDGGIDLSGENGKNSFRTSANEGC